MLKWTERLYILGLIELKMNTNQILNPSTPGIFLE